MSETIENSEELAISSIVQTSIDTIMVSFNSEITSDILKLSSFTVRDTGGYDYSERFLTVVQSNDFTLSASRNYVYLKIKDGMKLSKDTYNVHVKIPSNTLADESTTYTTLTASLNVAYMSSINGSIASVQKTSINTIRIEFSVSQSKDMFDVLNWSVIKSNGYNISNRFEIIPPDKNFHILELKLTENIDDADTLTTNDTIPADTFTIDFRFADSVVFTESANMSAFYHLPAIKSIDDVAIDKIRLNFDAGIDSSMAKQLGIKIRKENSSIDFMTKFISLSESNDLTNKSEYWSIDLQLLESEELPKDNYTIECYMDSEYVSSYSSSISYHSGIFGTIEYAVMQKKTGLAIKFSNSQSKTMFGLLNPSIIGSDGKEYKDSFNIVYTESSFTEIEAGIIDGKPSLPDGEAVLSFVYNKNTVFTKSFLSIGIESVVQSSIDKITLAFPTPIIGSSLDNMSFKLLDSDHNNELTNFYGVNESNEYNDDTSFESLSFKICSGHTLPTDNYNMCCFINDILVDSMTISIESMSYVDNTIISSEYVNKRKLKVSFTNAQSKSLLSVLTTQIKNADGVDIAEEFVLPELVEENTSIVYELKDASTDLSVQVFTINYLYGDESVYFTTTSISEASTIKQTSLDMIEIAFKTPISSLDASKLTLSIKDSHDDEYIEFFYPLSRLNNFLLYDSFEKLKLELMPKKVLYADTYTITLSNETDVISTKTCEFTYMEKPSGGLEKVNLVTDKLMKVTFDDKQTRNGIGCLTYKIIKDNVDATDQFNIRIDNDIFTSLYFVVKDDCPVLTKGNYTISFFYGDSLVYSGKVTYPVIQSIVQTSIDTLTINFKDEVDIEIINNATFRITSSDNLNYAKCFDTIAESNDFTNKKRITNFKLKIKAAQVMPGSVYTGSLYLNNLSVASNYTYLDYMSSVNGTISSIVKNGKRGITVKFSEEQVKEFLDFTEVQVFDGDNNDVSEYFKVTEFNPTNTFITLFLQYNTVTLDAGNYTVKILYSGRSKEVLFTSSADLDEFPEQVYFKRVIQYGADGFRFDIPAVVTRDYLQNAVMKVRNTITNEDVSDWFISIENSNSFTSDSITTFYLYLASNKELEDGTYEFSLFSSITAVSEDYIGIGSAYSMNSDFYLDSLEYIKQTSIDTIEIKMTQQVSERYLDNLTVSVQNSLNVKYTDYFNVTITNEQDTLSSPVVSIIRLKLKSGLIITKDVYEFSVKINKSVVGKKQLSIACMMTINGTISSITKSTLRQMKLTFTDQQTKDIFSVLKASVVTIDGVDLSHCFDIEPLQNTFTEMKITLCDEINCIAANTFIVSLVYDTVTILQKEVYLDAFVPTPKIGKLIAKQNSHGKYEIITTFSPSVELSMFSNGEYSIKADETTDVTDKFSDLDTSKITVSTTNGIEFVDQIAYEFDHTKSIAADEYTLAFTWTQGAISVSDNKSVFFPLIAPNFNSVSQTAIDELTLKFEKPFPKENISWNPYIKMYSSTLLRYVKVEFDEPVRVSSIMEATASVIEKDTYDVTSSFKSIAASNPDEYTAYTTWKNAQDTDEPMIDSIVLYPKDDCDIHGDDYSNHTVLLENSKTPITSKYEVTDYMKSDKYDFGTLFKPISETNVFAEEEASILTTSSLKLTLKDGCEIPTDSYEVVFYSPTEEGGDADIAFSGYIDIGYMIATSGISSISSISQQSLDTVVFSFTSFQHENLLSGLTASLLDIDGNEYGGCFKTIAESNPVYRTLTELDPGYKSNTEVLVSGLPECTVLEEAIGDKSLKLNKTDHFKLTLATDMAIPELKYTVELKLGEYVVYTGSMATKFMTASHPQISKIDIEGSNLAITFNPYAEKKSLLISNYKLTNNQNEDKTSCFGTIFNSEMTVTTQNKIDYISKMLIPVRDNVSLASGQYNLELKWNKISFLTDLVFNGSLPVITQGVKSVMLTAHDTLTIIFVEKQKVSYIKSLGISVVNSKGENCNELFKSMKDSNESLADANAETDTYSIKVADNENVLSDEYTFTLYTTTIDNSNDSSNEPVFVFSVNIIYMTNEFPTLSLVDNLSADEYVITKFTNDNVSQYYNRYVQLLTSTTKEVLTEDNASTYVDKDVKLYNKPDITELTFKFDDEISPCLLTSSNISIVNGDGDNVTECFRSVSESNRFKSRKVLDYLELVFEEPQTGDYFEECKFVIKNALGEEITSLFKTIEKSNSFPDDVKLNVIQIQPLDDGLIEELDSVGYEISFTDSTNTPITKFKCSVVLREIETVNKMKMLLNQGYSVNKDNYTVSMTCVNEPGIAGAVVIKAASYSGDLPFLSTNVGKISKVQSISLTSFKVTFTNDLSVKLFNQMKMTLSDTDGADYSSYLRPVTESNAFDGISTISQLPDPYSVVYELDAGKSIADGNYNITYTIDVSAAESDEADASTNYTLFDFDTKMDYLVKESMNSIKTVSICDIDSLKVEFENPVDASLLKQMSIYLEDENTQGVYDSFMNIKECNNFGEMLLLTDNKYLMYSEDGVSWNRSDTNYACALNDIYYDAQKESYYLLGGNGKIMTSSKYTSSSWTAITTGVSTSLNSIAKSGTTFVVVGDRGVVLHSSDGITWTKATSNTAANLTKVIYSETDGFIAVGYTGVIITSGDGVVWESMISGSTSNLTDICYHGDFTSTSGEATTVSNKGYYATSVDGNILFSIDGKTWKTYTTGNTSPLHSIASHEDTIIATGDGGVIISTTDSDTWNLVKSGVDYALKNIEYCDTMYIATATNGKWLTSLSGAKWTVNSSVYNFNFKNVNYIKSQYTNNRAITYFYSSLKDGESLGEIMYYEGYDSVDSAGNVISGVPTLSNNPAVSWSSDEYKRSHVGDIYMYQKFVSGITSVEYYQFRYDGTANAYSWVKCDTMPTIGVYTLHITKPDDTGNAVELYSKSGVAINYLTTKPGNISSVTLENPDSINDYSCEYPFLKVTFDKCNENAVYYATYSVINQTDGQDYSSYFLPIMQGSKLYSGSTMTGISLHGNPDNIMSLPAGKYTLKWVWSVYNLTKVIEYHDIAVKTPCRLIALVSRHETNVDTLVVTFSKKMPVDYFIQDGKKPTYSLWKMPKALSNIDTFNYFDYFEDVTSSTNFNTTSYEVDGVKYVDKINLTLRDGFEFGSGEYLFKMTNSKYSLYDDETVMNMTSYKYQVTQIVTSNMPTITGVSLIKYQDVVDTLDGHSPVTYSGPTDPAGDNITDNWKLGGSEEQNAHVGDKYVNTDTNTPWTFIYEADNWFWRQDTPKPYIEVSFGICPLSSETMMSLPMVLQGAGDDGSIIEYSQFFELQSGNWNYTQVKKGDTYYTQKCYIPADETKFFPGGTDLSFTWRWAIGSPYNDINVTGIKMNAVPHDYGVIEASLATYDVLQIHFSQKQRVTFIKNLNWSIIFRTINDDATQIVEEDVTSCFHSIDESNDFTSITTTDNVYLSLLEGQTLSSGIYVIRMTGEKDASDLVIDPDADLTVSFEATTSLSYMSSSPPSAMAVKLETETTTHVNPVLTIDFGENMPERNSIDDFWIDVVSTKDNCNYGTLPRDPNTHYFCSYGHKSIVYNTVTVKHIEHVKSIEIPMRNASALLAGTYNVVFHFADATRLEPIELYSEATETEPEVLASFTLKNSIMAPLGSIRSVKTNGLTNMVITIKLNASVRSVDLLKHSVVGALLKINSYNDIYKNLDFTFVDNQNIDRGGVFKAKVNASGSKLTLTLKSNSKFDPGEYTVKARYNDSIVFSKWKGDVAGLICNKVVSTAGDKICYILEETFMGKTTKGVYSSYKKAKARVKRLERLNKETAAQYALCKKCRKKKLISSSKIKAQMEKLSIPDGKMSSAVEVLATDYYGKLVSKEIGCSACKIDEIPNVTHVGSNYVSYQCDNYVKKNEQRTWKMEIATYNGAYPKSGSKVIYFEYIVKNGIQLDRGFKANKKGKPSSKFNAYEKKINSYLKKYKKKVAVCKKCKKCAIATKSGSNLGWGSSQFPIEIKTHTAYANAIAKKFTKAFSKKKVGCAKANFSFVKKNANYCKLSCTNAKANDITLGNGEYRAVFKK